jgi:hypothetical protein
METGPDRATGDVESDPGDGFELLPQPVIPRASAVINTGTIVFMKRRLPKKRVSF